MRHFFSALFLSLWAFSSLHAATRADVNILQATENIRFLSQKIAKDYLYLYLNPAKSYLLGEIGEQLEDLTRNIRTISVSTSDEDTKNILEFLVYSKVQIQQLLSKKPQKESAALMLDYSETLLEGANSIARDHLYAFSASEKMMMLAKKVQFLLERGAKYYMALNAGLDSTVNKEQYADAILRLKKIYSARYEYPYPKKLMEEEKRMINYWKTTGNLYDRAPKLFVSNLIYLATLRLEDMTEEFVIYHSKNQ